MTNRQRHRKRRTFKPLNNNKASAIQNTTCAPEKVIVRYVSTSVQTDDELSQVKKKQLPLPQLESVNRISSLPIVETGWNYAENVYNKIKESNGLVKWTLGQAENTVYTVFDTAAPAILLLQGPLTSVDKLVCKSLDFVEEKIPSINLPPEMIYWNTKQYAKETVSNKIVHPVLKRADSVKQIGNTVLASKYTAFAADTLDGALHVADKYVDKYLPADDEQGSEETDSQPINGPAGKAIHTIHHADRLGRKLKRRLTKRTLAEVKALKQQSAEAVHVLVYVAELIATDPKLALQKGKELWESLSKDEPENQARPENLEQLLVLLTRESARRIVHLINFTTAVTTKLSKNVYNSALSMASKLLVVSDSLVKTAHLEHVEKTAIEALRKIAQFSTIYLKQLNAQLTKTLEELAQSLETKEPPKSALSVPQIKVDQLKATVQRNNSVQDRNGVDNSSS